MDSRRADNDEVNCNSDCNIKNDSKLGLKLLSVVLFLLLFLIGLYYFLSYNSVSTTGDEAIQYSQNPPYNYTNQKPEFYNGMENKEIISKRGMSFLYRSSVINEFSEGVLIPVLQKQTSQGMQEYLDSYSINTLEEIQKGNNDLIRDYNKVVEPYKKNITEYYNTGDKRTYNNLYFADIELMTKISSTAGEINNLISNIIDYKLETSHIKKEKKFGNFYEDLYSVTSSVDYLAEYFTTSYLKTLYAYDNYDMVEYINYKNGFRGNTENVLLSKADKLSDLILSEKYSKNDIKKIHDLGEYIYTSLATFDGWYEGKPTLGVGASLENVGLLYEELHAEKDITESGIEKAEKVIKQYVIDRDTYYNRYTYFSVPKEDKNLLRGYTNTINITTYTENK